MENKIFQQIDVSVALEGLSRCGYKVTANNPTCIELFNKDVNTRLVFNKKNKTFYHSDGSCIDMNEYRLITNLLIALRWLS